jgi:FkbM family methyltransferase
MTMRLIIRTITSLRNLVRATMNGNSKIWRILRLIDKQIPNKIRGDFRDIRGIMDSFSSVINDIFFIQIGSGDGITGDPIHTYIKRNGWSGILVEPVKYMFDRLVKNYQGQENLIFENIAISDSEGTRDFWYLNGIDNNFPRWYTQLGSFIPEVTLKNSCEINNIEKYLTSEQVSCLTLEALIRKHNVNKINLLHIDTEGYDFDIIKQFDFQRFEPEIILYEHRHLNYRKKKECMRYLKLKGYNVLQGANDTIAFRGNFQGQSEKARMYPQKLARRVSD